MSKHIDDLFEEHARAGNPQFAIAYALLQLARQQERLADKVGQLGFDGPSSNPGAFEFIGMQLRDISSALESLNINASVDIANG